MANRPIRFPLDDAYITIANARQLLTGAVDGYGQHTPSGATSLVHLWLLAGMGLILDWPAALLVLCILAAALYVAGVYFAIRAISGSALFATLGSMAGLLGAHAWFQLMNGLETGWAMAAVAWCVYLAQYPDDPLRQRLLAALAGVLPFIRPDLALLSAMLALAAAIRLYRVPGRLGQLAAITLAVATLLAVLALFSVGAILPQTAGAKVAFFADAGFSLGRRALITLVLLGTVPLAFFLIGLLALPMVRQGWAFGGFVLLFLLVSTLTLPSGLSHNEQRYLYPLLPLALAGWAAIGAHKSLLGGRAGLAVALAAVLACSGLVTGGWKTYRDMLADTGDQERLVAWARANLPADARILIHDAGYIGWQTRFRLVDVVGLKTPSSIAVHQRYTLPSAGALRGKAVAEIARQAHVTHAIIMDRPFWGDIADHLRKAGWNLQPLRPQRGTLYQVYRLTPPTDAAVKD